MSNPDSFNQTVNETVKNFIYWMQQIQTLQDRMSQDPTLAAAAAASAQAAGRTDLTTADYNNLANAIVQIMFTWNSGTPAEKSYFYKML
jgi:hypothetical protein